MKKILITGSNGLLGQKLVYALLNEKVNIIATSRGNNRISQKNGYIYKSLDITDSHAVHAILKKYLPDTLINTAAMTNVDDCEKNKEECWKQNVVSVENCINTLKSLQTESYNPHFIHLSTDFIFDGENGPYREDDIPNPLSYYALSKYKSEQCVQQSQLRWTIIRTIIIYGLVDNMSRSNLILWAKSALEQGKQISVVNDQFRSPTLAEDLAKGCLLAAFKEALGIYHISGKEIKSILELVYDIADFFNLNKSLIKTVTSDTLNQPAKRPPYTGFILDKAIKNLGYTPHSFQDGLGVVKKQLEEKILKIVGGK